MIIYGVLIFSSALLNASAFLNSLIGGDGDVQLVSSQASQSQFSYVSVDAENDGGQDQPDLQMIQQQQSFQSQQFQSVSIGQDEQNQQNGGVSSPSGSLSINQSNTAPESGLRSPPFSPNQLQQNGTNNQIQGGAQINQAQQMGDGSGKQSQTVNQSNTRPTSNTGSPSSSPIQPEETGADNQMKGGIQINQAQQIGDGNGKQPQTINQSNTGTPTGSPQVNQAQQKGSGRQTINQSNSGSPPDGNPSMYDVRQPQSKSSPQTSSQPSTQPSPQSSSTRAGSGNINGSSSPSSNQPDSTTDVQANVGVQVSSGDQPQTINQSNSGGASPRSGTGDQQPPTSTQPSGQTPSSVPYPRQPKRQINQGLLIGSGPQTTNQSNSDTPTDQTQSEMSGSGGQAKNNNGYPARSPTGSSSPSTSYPSQINQSQQVGSGYQPQSINQGNQGQPASAYNQQPVQSGSPSSSRMGGPTQGNSSSSPPPTPSSSSSGNNGGQGQDRQSFGPQTTQIVTQCVTLMSMVDDYTASQSNSPDFMTGGTEKIARRWSMDVFYTSCMTIVNSQAAINLGTDASTNGGSYGFGASAGV